MPKAVFSVISSALALMAWSATAVAAPINLAPFAFIFNHPIGIDFQDTSGQLIMSVNFFNGTPHNLDLVDSITGTPTPFSNLAGLTNELKIATVRNSGCQGGFTAGEVFTGNGNNGEVVRISADGMTVVNPWVSLGGSALVRGSLFQDRFCAANGDLIVVTGNEQEGFASNDSVGAVYRVKSDGTVTQLTTSIATHLEGVVTLPDIPAVFGPAAGKILAGAEEFLVLGRPPTTAADYNPDGGAIYVVDPDATDVWFTISNGHSLATACTLDANGEATPNHCNFHTATAFHPEDLDVIRRNSRFFGVAFSEDHVLTTLDPNTGAPDFHQFDSLCGQVLITQELPFGFPSNTTPPATSGLSSLAWNGTGFDVTPIASNRDGTIFQWEHVTFTSGQDCNTTITIDKTPDNATFKVGDAIFFKIVVKNTGNFDATDVKLSDPLPKGPGLDLTWSVTSVTPGPASDCGIDATQTLTCNFGTLAPGATQEVVVTISNPGGAPLDSCTGAQLPNLATATSTSAVPSSVQDSGDYTCTPANLVTVTQGGWGAPAHGNNPGTVLNAYFAAHPGYAPKIGDIANACGGKTLTFTSANAVRAFLPQGGPPSKLTASATNPTSSAAGVFAGQVLALTLNTQVLSSGSSLLSFVMPSGPAAGKTVATILADADKALGGCGLPSYVTSISQLNDIVDTINNMFD